MSQSAPSSKKSRRRELNVVYFVDSSRTRSFRIPLSRVNVILLSVFGAFMWTIISFFVIGWQSEANDKVEARLRDTLAVIFKYEAKHEGAFDRAYGPNANIRKSVAARERRTRSARSPLSSNSQPATRVVAPQERRAQREADVDSDQAIRELVLLPAEIQDPVVEEVSSGMRLKLKIQNPNHPERIEGYVWAIADFESAQKKKIYVNAPKRITIGQDGNIENPRKAFRFSIKHFKRKTFDFAFPEDTSGKFTSVRVGVSDKNGTSVEITNIPVEISSSQGAKAATTEKDNEKQG